MLNDETMQARGQQFASLDFAHENADDRHKQERAQAAWKHGHAGLQERNIP